MAPLARMLQFRLDLCHVIEQASNVFRRSDVFDCHFEEFFTIVTVFLNGGIVQVEEVECLYVVYPHRDWVTTK